MGAIAAWLGNFRSRVETTSIFGARKPRTANVKNLYVLEVAFPIADNKELREALEKALDVPRNKYGIDFLVLEPGFKIKRFDDY